MFNRSPTDKELLSGNTKKWYANRWNRWFITIEAYSHHRRGMVAHCEGLSFEQCAGGMWHVSVWCSCCMVMVYARRHLSDGKLV